RQDLSPRVRDEVRTREPPHGLAQAADPQELLPPPGLRRHGHEREDGRRDEPRHARGAEDVDRLAEIDLVDDVADRGREDDERQCAADRPLQPERRAWTRRGGATASRTSSSEWAGENGRDRTSRPARSVTGRSGWCGASRWRYALSRCTGRKWIDVPMFSS